MSGRKELIDEIAMILTKEHEDIRDIVDEIYIVLDKYEIQPRTTEIALCKADRNEYLVNKFLISKTVKGCTERTLHYYSVTIRKILEAIGKTVDDIEADDIRLYIILRQKRDGITKTTAGNESRALSTFYTWLTREGLIDRNPMLKIDPVKNDTKKEKAMTDMEVELIWNATSSNRERAIVEVLLSTGCRVSELVNMRIDELEGDKIIVHGKGEKDRIVYLNARAVMALKNYLEERKDNNPYIFCGGIFKKPTKGKATEWYKRKVCVHETRPTDKSTIESVMRKLGRRSGVKGVHPHRFRKTCATMALRRGMPIEKVSMMLGHASLDTTKIYLSIEQDELEMAHRKYVV